MKLLFLTLCFFPLLFSCSSGKKANLLTERQLVEVLYDLQLAQSLAGETHPDDAEARLKYRQSVLYKHKIDETQFNNSLAYYSRQPKEMKVVYQQLQDYIAQQGKQGAASASNGSTEQGDTTLLWHADHKVLSAELQNRLTHQQPLKSALRQGDRVVLQFQTNWLYLQGMKQVWASIALQQKGKTVEAASMLMQSYQEQQLLELPVNAISRFDAVQLTIVQTAEWESSPQVVQLKDLKLFVVRPKSKSAAPPSNDTAPKQLSAERILPLTQP